jgi:hypothetical protein
MDTHALATIRSALRALRLERDLRGYGEMTPERWCPLIERALSLLTAIVSEAAKSPPRRAPRPHEPTLRRGLTCEW